MLLCKIKSCHYHASDSDAPGGAGLGIAATAGDNEFYSCKVYVSATYQGDEAFGSVVSLSVCALTLEYNPRSLCVC